ncbi:MAG: glycosyltransferase family A protein [Bacteroidota bacterium]
MNNHPSISIILPFYNAVNTLSIAIESILNQSFTNFELVLVDNFSTDGSWETSKSFAKNDNRIVLLRKRQKGVSFAFNKGLAASKGKFIARMDADDISYPNRLEKQFSFLQENPLISIVTTQVDTNLLPQNKGFQTFITWSNSLITPEQIALSRFIEQPVVNPTLMCRKVVFDKIGSYQQGNFPEDYDWFLRIFEGGLHIAKLSQKLFFWRDSSTRLSRTDNRYSIVAFYKTKAFYLAKWLKQNKPRHLKIAIWGMGKKSRQRSSLLKQHGIHIEAYVDVLKNINIGITYFYYENLPKPGMYFIISYVGNRGARNKIKFFLLRKGYQEGIDFILAA